MFGSIHPDFRNASTRGPSAPPLMVQDKSLNMAIQIRKQGYNDNILKVNSSLSGETASDENSFIKRLLR